MLYLKFLNGYQGPTIPLPPSEKSKLRSISLYLFANSETCSIFVFYQGCPAVNFKISWQLT